MNDTEAIRNYLVEMTEKRKRALYALQDSDEHNDIADQLDRMIDFTVETGTIPDYYVDKFLETAWGETYINVGYSTWELRRKYTHSISWCIVTKQWIDILYDHLKGKSGVEIYAGGGIISKELKNRGLDIRCTDDHSWDTTKRYYTEVENLGAYDTIKQYRDKQLDFVICSWIPMEDKDSAKWIKELKHLHPNCEIIYIGEPNGGCTANDGFFDNVIPIVNKKMNKFSDKINDAFISWNGIHDYIVFYKAK